MFDTEEREWQDFEKFSQNLNDHTIGKINNIAAHFLKDLSKIFGVSNHLTVKDQILLMQTIKTNLHAMYYFGYKEGQKTINKEENL